jgi:Tol biopolymer transport system component
MALPPGTKVGVYEITGPLGAGGMGEVYRARDARLGRDVALKILPEAFVADAERLARFDREAKTLAALNHPHIAHLFGFEDSGTTRALVMELVEGEDLAQRLRRGPLMLDDALAIARQIADALEAAHEQGIIHRDLKPANIKVRDDGAVKVLDFGLAKAIASSASSSGSDTIDAALNSPTITSPAMTMRGMILGTAAYMSPEQAKGKAVDKRADIWAFGCVLYEMVTGRRAFAGDDVSDTLASVLRAEVDWSGVPVQIQRLLRKCLERDPRKRLHDIGDAWDLLDLAPARSAAPPSGGARVAWGIAALFAAAAATLAVIHFRERASVPEVLRFEVQAPPQNALGIYLALSPNGRRLAFTARDDKGVVRLWLRDIDALEARVLPGTEDAWSPFWSPDSRHLAFAVERTLKRIDVAGGLPQTICVSPRLVGIGDWNVNGDIVFGTRGVGGLSRVPANGGAVTEITAIDLARGETFHSFPSFLPDGKRFVYVRNSSNTDLQGIYLGEFDAKPEDQPLTRLLPAVMGPVRVVNGARGRRILYLRDGTLVAQPFDVERLQLAGDPITVAERIGSSGSFGFVAASDNDVLAYRVGEATLINYHQLTWLDRKGETTGIVGDVRPVSSNPAAVALSPDATKAIVVISPTPTGDLWLLEFARSIFTRLTFDPGPDLQPVWSPDGRRVAFRSSRNRVGDLYVKDVSGSSEETALVQLPGLETPTDWSRDGKFLLFSLSSQSISGDLWVRPMTGPTEPVRLLDTPYEEVGGRFAPDGRSVAYTSNESGRPEVYIRPFTVGADGKPALGPKWQVSNEGGVVPKWRGDGKELYYRRPDGSLMAVDVTVTRDDVRTALPRALFTLPPTLVNWDVTGDGQRFLVSRPITPPSTEPISVVVNWQVALGQ